MPPVAVSPIPTERTTPTERRGKRTNSDSAKDATGQCNDGTRLELGEEWSEPAPPRAGEDELGGHNDLVWAEVEREKLPSKHNINKLYDR